MVLNRDYYLNQLIRKINDKRIKIVTGLRRSGKSVLLNELFYNYLIKIGVNQDHIIRIPLDDYKYRLYKNPDELYNYVTSILIDKNNYYLILDEIQLVDNFVDVLNGFLHIKNVDTYVTGSNAKFLSKDIITEFRGRGDQIHIYPLSFSEFVSVFNGPIDKGWNYYIIFGGLPKLFYFVTDEDRAQYLKDIFNETYLKDIKERNKIINDAELEELLDFLSSSVGSYVNQKKLSDTFKSVKKVSIHPDTIKKYLDYLQDSFLIDQAKRYDIKGKKYINTPSKYYFTDVGLRNARLNFRQEEETHIMENIIYNELKIRGFNVDVGVVEHYELNNQKKSVLKQSEVDFVCNFIDKRYYIQVSLNISESEKLLQEKKSLMNINDYFKKIIITKGIYRSHYTDDGILLLDLYEFLLNPDSINI